MQQKFEILSWPNWKDSSTLAEEHQEDLRFVASFQQIGVPDAYKIIWKNVSLAVQLKKASAHGLTKQETIDCFQSLVLRPYFLCALAKRFNCNNFAEVGTAQGLQFFSFAEHVGSMDGHGHVWSCDIIDVRNRDYVGKYEKNTSFCLGDSGDLSAEILKQNKKIDFFYIDGAHQRGSVLQDVENLRKTQSEFPIWVFDDFDQRFGCYHDIKSLCLQNTNFAVYRVGNAASGNPNHQVIIIGKI